jgi:hypothetical protein
MSVVSSAIRSADDLPAHTPAPGVAQGEPLKVFRHDFKARYGIELVFADERWGNLLVARQPAATTFEQTLERLLRGQSYYLVRQDGHRIELSILGSTTSDGAAPATQPALVETGRTRVERDTAAPEREDAEDLGFYRAADLGIEETPSSEWVELHDGSGDVERVRVEDLE